MVLLILTAIIVSTTIILGIFTFLANPTNQTNRYYALSTGFLALWMVVNFLENEPSLVGYETLSIFLRLDFALAITYFFVWFVFCFFFALKPFPALEQYKIFFFLTLSTLLLACLSIFTDTVITNITFKELIQFTNGPLWGLYAFHMIGTAIGGLLLLFIGKHKAKKTGHTILIHQINIVILGFSIALGNSLVINLFLQPFFPISIEISRFGIYGMVVFVALTSYAIARYHFFDIKLAVIRTFSFFSLSLAVILLYVYVLTIGMSRLFEKELAPDFLFVSVLLTTIVALSFHPLQQKIAKLTKHFFYKNYYDSEKLLAELTHIMASNINIDVMTTSLLLTLKSTLHLTGAAFMVYKKDGTFDLKTSATDHRDHCLNRSGAEKIDAAFGEGSPCPMGAKMCRFQDVEEGRIKELFRALHIGLIIPITTAGKITTLFILGDKKSGEVYSPQDLEFLSIFADEVGIAIQNAQAYREITEFSTVLEARVNERTKQLEEAQAEKVEKALAVTKLRDEFVFIATHELRAPITAIRLFLETVSSEQIPARLKPPLDSIYEASNHLNQLIDDLLEIARSESGPSMLPVQTIDLVPLVERTVHELRPLAEARDISVSYVHADQPHPALMHKDKLTEVVINLISNAIKYNKHNGNITITFKENEDTITTEISDTGYGIPQKYHDKIFEKFFRATSAKVEEITGTGLGLFISKMLMEKMGGSITFSSLENEGSTFAFTLRKGHTNFM
jgi:signal transduction histidine kinase